MFCRVRTESSGVGRLAPIPGLFPLCTFASEQGAFAPPALPSFITTTPPSAIRSSRLHPSRGRRCPAAGRAPPRTSLVARSIVSPCVLPPLPRWMRRLRITLASAPPSAFLVVMASRHPRRRFEACSVFTHVAARMARLPPNGAFSRSASAHLLPPGPPLVLPAGARVGRVGLHRRINRAFPRHT